MCVCVLVCVQVDAMLYILLGFKNHHIFMVNSGSKVNLRLNGAQRPKKIKQQRQQQAAASEVAAVTSATTTNSSQKRKKDCLPRPKSV